MKFSLQVLEKHVTEESNSGSLDADSFFTVANNVKNFLEDEENTIPLLGCVEHNEQFTGHLIHFFLVTRMYFICRHFNTIQKNKEKVKNLKKLSRLVNPGKENVPKKTTLKKNVLKSKITKRNILKRKNDLKKKNVPKKKSVPKKKIIEKKI